MTTSTNTPRVWFITGTSSGFGRAIAEAALERGERVVATARNPERVVDLEERYPDAARAVALDVTDPAQARVAVDAAREAFDRIDVVVNNAGYGLFGALEELSDDELRRQFETNVFGVLNVTRAVLPVLRRRRSGHLVQMSSLAGTASIFPGEAAYAGSKFAVEGISEALAGELGHLGIRVTIVEPGPFRTDFAGGASVRPVSIDDYEASVGATLEAFAEMGGAQPGDPELAARAIIRAVDADEPPLRLALGELAISNIRAKLDRQGGELDAWERLGQATAYAAA
jgi:NAD(P)-dependent dehydrogenase (short-subunit alcohol dehydrogenase family)